MQVADVVQTLGCVVSRVRVGDGVEVARYGSLSEGPLDGAGHETVLCGYPVLSSNSVAQRALTPGTVGRWRLRVATRAGEVWVEVTARDSGEGLRDIALVEVEDDSIFFAMAARARFLDQETRLPNRRAGEMFLSRTLGMGVLVGVRIENLLQVVQMTTQDRGEEMLEEVGSALHAGIVRGEVFRAWGDTFVAFLPDGDTETAVFEAERLIGRVTSAIELSRNCMRAHLRAGVLLRTGAEPSEELRLLALVLNDTLQDTPVRSLSSGLSEQDAVEQHLLERWQRFGVANSLHIGTSRFERFETGQLVELSAEPWWESVTYGAVPAERVIERVRNAGVELDVDWHVARWVRDNLDARVNVSMKLNYATLHNQRLAKLLELLGNHARVDIPEEVLVQGSHATRDAFDVMAAARCEVSIVGYSGHPVALSWLERPCVTSVKLKPSLCRDASTSRKGLSALAAAALLAGAYDLEVMACGVSHPRDVQVLLEAGISIGGGPYIDAKRTGATHVTNCPRLGILVTE